MLRGLTTDVVGRVDCGAFPIGGRSTLPEGVDCAIEGVDGRVSMERVGVELQRVGELAVARGVTVGRERVELGVRALDEGMMREEIGGVEGRDGVEGREDAPNMGREEVEARDEVEARGGVEGREGAPNMDRDAEEERDDVGRVERV